jgi:hypothetical protein
MALMMQTQVALSRDRPLDEYQAPLASSLEEYERMARMIENTLFLARADNAELALRRETLDVGAELAHIGEYFAMLAEDKGVSLALGPVPALALEAAPQASAWRSSGPSCSCMAEARKSSSARGKRCSSCGFRSTLERLQLLLPHMAGADQHFPQKVHEGTDQGHHRHHEACRNQLAERQVRRVAQKQHGDHQADEQAADRAQRDGEIDEVSALVQGVKLPDAGFVRAGLDELVQDPCAVDDAREPVRENDEHGSHAGLKEHGGDRQLDHAAEVGKSDIHWRFPKIMACCRNGTAKVLQS